MAGEKEKDNDMDFSMDGYLYNNLLYAKKKVVDDWDFIYIVDGGERKGKSVLAQQIAFFCDPSFNLDRIVFTPEQFKKAVLKADKYQAIVYDEAYGGINSRATMTKVNRSIVKMLTEIGSRNLFIIIVLPCFFELDRYVALWRSRALFHVYVNDKLQRGFFNAYNEERKKDLYMKGKKFMTYDVVMGNFHGRFTNKWIVDKVAYEEKKRRAQIQDELIDLNFQDDSFVRKMFIFVHNNPNIKGFEERMKVLNMKQASYYRYCRRFADELGGSLEMEGAELPDIPPA